jgi:hypothetical protein
MRAAAGSSNNTKPVNSKIIGDCLNINAGVCYRALGESVRSGIARPIVTYQADTEPVEDNPAGARAVAAARRSMKEEYRLSVRVPEAFQRQPTPIGGRDDLRHRILPARPSPAYSADA